MEITNFKSSMLAILLVAGFLFATTKPTLADTYQKFVLTSEVEVEFYGMDDSGNIAFAVAPFSSAFCEQNPCFETFHDGLLTGFDVATPGLVRNDSGTPCTPAVPPDKSVVVGVCNNGRDTFTAFLSPMQIRAGVYVGSYPDISQVASTAGELIYMNALGDIVYVDGENSERWYLLLDTSTSVPEPRSIVLLATGALGVVSLIRRRLCR